MSEYSGVQSGRQNAAVLHVLGMKPVVTNQVRHQGESGKKEINPDVHWDQQVFPTGIVNFDPIGEFQEDAASEINAAHKELPDRDDLFVDPSDAQVPIGHPSRREETIPDHGSVFICRQVFFDLCDGVNQQTDDRQIGD